MTTVVKTRTRVPFASAAMHTATITRRNVLRFIRIPQLLLFSTVQPVMFLFLFNFVFGGAITTGTPAGSDQYINWLIPGILVQSAAFGATATAMGLTEDLAAGVIERFRSLPMARSAVLTGRTLADLVRNTFVFSLMLVVGYLMGWRFEQGFWKMALGFAVALLFGYSFSWVMAAVGLAVKTPEAAQAAGFLPIFPLVFASSIIRPDLNDARVASNFRRGSTDHHRRQHRSLLDGSGRIFGVPGSGPGDIDPSVLRLDCGDHRGVCPAFGAAIQEGSGLMDLLESNCVAGRPGSGRPFMLSTQPATGDRNTPKTTKSKGNLRNPRPVADL